VSLPDHLTAVARNARALATRGDLRGAQAMLDQALEPAAAMLGPNHPEVLTATRLLASLHRDLGDLSGARRLLEEALTAGQFALGDDSRALLPLTYDLALLADELGNRHEARRNFTRLLHHGPAALGPDHEYVRAARRYLGVAPSTPDPGATAPAPDATPPPSVTPPPVALPPTVPPAPVPWVSDRPPSTQLRPAPAPPWSPRDSGYHHGERRQSRAPMLVLVLVAVMALAGGGIAAYLVFHPPGGGPGPAPRATATANSDALKPPGDLKLRDDGSSITLTWTDPSKGTVPFIVAGGRAENALNPLGSVESGKSTYTLSGISSTADYCFLVAALYSPQHTVPSALICTKRAGSSPSSHR
jgi:tetratricopeptide (TPR) repeat protein